MTEVFEKLYFVAIFAHAKNGEVAQVVRASDS